jgi:transcriptional regulator with XRE-family HTH domain
MRAARELAGLTLAKVAAKCGVSITAVAQWERGAIPGDDLRALLAGLYGVDEAILFAEYEARMAANRELLRPA